MLVVFNEYKFLFVPFILWFGIQTFKVLYEYFTEGKWDIKRFMGAGGMPSSHSAVVVSLATLIAKHIGINTPIFALSALFAFITMYDAAGVRRAVGKQAHILNKVVKEYKDMTPVEILQEKTGHTPVQVAAGAIIGFIAGIIL